MSTNGRISLLVTAIIAGFFIVHAPTELAAQAKPLIKVVAGYGSADGAVAPFLIYGVLYASSSDSRWHESGHGTAFRTDWLNNALYEIASFMVMPSCLVGDYFSADPELHRSIRQRS